MMVWTLMLGAAMALVVPMVAQEGAQTQAQSTAVVNGETVPLQAPTPFPSLLSHCRAQGQEYQPMDEKMPCPSALVPKKIYTVPAGTKVLLQLRSSVNTRSAKPGDGVYLVSTFPVVVGNRVMIPAGVYVQGEVDHVARAGRVKGKAQLDMHFTSIIFPNGSVVEIPGMVNSLPGAKQQSVKDDGEGTIEQSGGKGRNAGETAKIAIPTGGSVGSIAGLGSSFGGGCRWTGRGSGYGRLGIALHPRSRCEYR
jgi:hypothetical protein